MTGILLQKILKILAQHNLGLIYRKGMVPQSIICENLSLLQMCPQIMNESYTKKIAYFKDFIESSKITICGGCGAT